MKIYLTGAEDEKEPVIDLEQYRRLAVNHEEITISGLELEIIADLLEQMLNDDEEPEVRVEYDYGNDQWVPDWIYRGAGDEPKKDQKASAGTASPIVGRIAPSHPSTRSDPNSWIEL